jgi:proline iminopeptidase
MPTVDVHQTHLFYTESGTGVPCLVMHGGLGLDHTYLRGLDIVSDVLHLVYYDHRHNGRSGRPP